MLVDFVRKLDGIATTQYLGHKISYDPSTVIGGLLASHGEFEKKEMELCSEYILDQCIVLDIGANIGLHSIYFSELAKQGKIISLEPSLTTFDLLVNNVAGIPNIVPLNIAASGSGGIADFFDASDNAYSSLIDTKRKEIIGINRVPCMKIDDLVSSLELCAVDFVKIDVEGMEYEVLRGMLDVISKYKPVIFCEIYKGKHSNQKPDETVSLLIQNGYQALVVRKGELVEYQKHDDAFFNYLFLPKAR